MSKRVRKGISLLASFAMGAGLMIGTFAAPAAAAADDVTINTAGGVRYDREYRTELHGQVCDFYYNTGDDFDYTYANEGVFINGTFKGPNAAEMELKSVTLVDLPDTSNNDQYDLDWVDFNRYNRAGVSGEYFDGDYELGDGASEMEECSSTHDFEIFMAQGGDSEFAMWDVAGDYTYRLVFKNEFDLNGVGDGTVTITRDVTITVAGDVASMDLKLDGDKTNMTWPVQTEYFDEQDSWINATLTFLDADGNVTHPLYTEEGEDTPDISFGYDEYDGANTEEIYQSDYLDADWSEEVWIMSNDWETGDYMIHDEESDAAWYSWEHADSDGFGFNYTSAYFAVPLAEGGNYVYNDTPLDDGEDYWDDWWAPASDYDVGGSEIALKQGLVDELGDFTGGIEVSFYVASDVAEVSHFWVRWDDTDDEGDMMDSNTVSIDFRDWVDPDTLGENTNIVAKTGVVVPGEWFDCNWYWWGGGCYEPSDLPTEGSNYYDLGIVRTDVTSFDVTYTGGVDEDDEPLNAGKFIAIEPADFDLTYSNATTLAFGDYDVMLTDADGNLTISASTEDVDPGYLDAAYISSWEDASDWDNYGYGYAEAEVQFQDAGFWPSAKLQNTSVFAKVQPLLYEPEIIWSTMTEWHKSVLLESTQTLTYKVTDAWGDIIKGMGAYLASDCWTDALWCAEFAEYDDFEVTNASGLVTYTVENIDDPADVVDRHEGQDDCDSVINCQEKLADVQGEAADYYTQAEFWVYPSASYLDNYSYSIWSSDYTRFQFVRSTTVDDIVGEVWTYDLDEWVDIEDYDGTGTGAIHIDTEGDEKEDIFMWTVPINADGIALAAVGSYSVSGTAGTYANSICDEQGLWWNAFWCFTDASYDDLYSFGGGDKLKDVSEFTESVSGTANPRGFETVVTGTLVGTATFTVTVDGYSESFDQEYFNTVEDARYIAAVATDATNVIAGNIATATFKVTDRFGNVVEDVDVTFSENGLGEFLSNDPASTTGVTDVDGLTSVDILTPANSMGSSAVTATFDSLQTVLTAHDLNGDGAADVTAAVESADDTVAWTHITPTIDVKALKYRAGIKVFVQNALGNITRVYVDGKLKRIFVPATINGFQKILLKKGGKRTVVVTIASPLGNIFETYELKIKKNKKK